MKVVSIIISIFVSLLFFTSCDNSNVNIQAFGEVEYYPDFLWVDENIKPVTKTFCFDFSEDSKNDDNLYAEFAFVDNGGNVISPQVMQVLIDGELLSDNKFKVYSKQDSCRITFQFTPSAVGGKYQGYLKLVDHYDLDRLDSQVLTPGQNVDVFQWTLYYNKCMNPLAKILMWICIVIAALVALWLVMIKPFVYPTFRAIKKTLIIPNQAPISINFKGARMVVLDSVRHKQSWWNQIWTGKIVYKQHPAITSPITFMPKGRGRRILFKADAMSYICSPNPIDIQPSRIVDVVNNQQIVIQ